MTNLEDLDKKLYEILVPTIRRCDGKPYTTRFHRVWDSKIRAISGGLTILRPSVGQWINPDDNELFIERMIPVRIMCTSDEMGQIALITKKYYDQIKIMYYRVSDEVYVV